MKHRRLLSSPTIANETAKCSDFCDPATFPSPPPSVLSPATSLSGKVKDHLSIILISFIVLSGFFLFVIFCLGWRNNRLRRFQAQSDNRDDDENRIDHHHIRFITSVGLQQSVINSITICRYKKEEGLIEGTECSICLSEFREDEMLRLLPKCSHAFHIHCIDTWLRSHTNCPLCRARIIAESVDFCSDSIDENLDSLSLDTQMHISQTDGEQHPELGQNWAGTEEGLEIPRIGSERTLKENVNGDSLVPDDYELVKNDLWPLRRCVSMDHMPGSSLANCSPVEGVGNAVHSVPNSVKTRNRLRRSLSWDFFFC